MGGCGSLKTNNDVRMEALKTGTRFFGCKAIIIIIITTAPFWGLLSKVTLLNGFSPEIPQAC
jgi:hypothetical protein